MTISIKIPLDGEEDLRRAFGGDLNQAALESMVIEGYRTRRLSHFQVQRILGFDNRWDTDNWLGDRGLSQNYTSQDLDADRRTLDEILGSSGK